MAGKPKASNGGAETRCYNLAVEISELACAVDDIRTAAQHRDTNALIAPLHHIAQAKHLHADLGPAGPIVRKLAARAQRLGAAIRSRGLSMRLLADKDADFIFNDAGVMWSYVRQLQDAASRSCGSRPPGMVWPLEAFPPIPKGLGR